MALIKLNDINLYYEIHGQGPPLMLMAGLASDSQSWGDIITELAKHYQLIIPDNRGAGRTTPHNQTMSIEIMADDCMALATALKLGSFSVLGHSMGGFIALDCAMRYPQKITNLILVATAAHNLDKNKIIFKDLIEENDDKRFFRNIFHWLFSERFFVDEKVVESTVQLAINYPFRQSKTDFINQVDAINAFNCQANLNTIKAKTLLISGENDALFPAELTLNSLKEIPCLKAVTIAEAAHAIHLEKPTEFVDCVLQFMHN